MKHLVLCGATLLLLGLGCSRTPSNSELFNEPAAVPAGAPLQVLQWKTITSSVDAPHETMSILFGNDVAIESARSGKQAEYPTGSVLSLVTWSQQEDKHWFGARIPKDFKTMEVVKVSAGADGKASTSYERYEGQARVASEDDERRAYILEQRASVMP